MKHFFLIVVFVLLCATNVRAQSEHHLGLAISNVVGPSYTFSHNRWSITGIAGWLTGFKGGYASLEGTYDIFPPIYRWIKREEHSHRIRVNMGLGFFAQDYINPSDKQQQWANHLQYLSPFGCNIIVEGRYNLLSDWQFAFRMRGPVPFSDKDIDYGSRSYGYYLLSSWQLVIQYKL
jgi:hypothetical protein